MKHTNLSILDRIATALVAAVLVAAPFYAFLTVWGSSLVGHYTALRLVPDVSMALLVLYGMSKLREADVRRQVASSLLFRLIAAYVVLLLALGVVALVKHEVTRRAVAYGLLIDLRLVAWFCAVWIVARRNDWWLRHWKPLVLWPLAAVVAFGLLQFFVLPPDFLRHFGYVNGTTITPFQTINQNSSTPRIQSTLRGPNPLGAYLVLGASLSAVAYVATKRPNKLALTLLSLGALAVTFSRSAWIGAFVALAIAGYLVLKKGRARHLFVAGLVATALLGGTTFVLLRHSKGVQDAVLHVSQSSTAARTSNAGHATAFRDGVRDLVHEPFGRGPGTAGPASVYNTDHGFRNSENYFLGLGQELGWAGLLLFVAITIVVALELWQRRVRPLALGLFATLIGLTIVNQLSYAWTDPTLAYVWWGLAGIMLAKPAQTEIPDEA